MKVLLLVSAYELYNEEEKTKLLIPLLELINIENATEQDREKFLNFFQSVFENQEYSHVQKVKIFEQFSKFVRKNKRDLIDSKSKEDN